LRRAADLESIDPSPQFGGPRVRNSIYLDLWVLTARTARLAGRLVGWTTGGGRPAIAGLALTAIAVVVFGKWEILAIYLVVLLLIAGWRLRRRIVIDEITDNTPDGTLARGTAALLAGELARIAEALRPVSEGRGIQMAKQVAPIEIATGVEDFAADLRGAVTAESKVTIGPIGFPIGALAAILGRFVQAPRLLASLRDADGQVVLVARLTGGGQHAAWQTQRSGADGQAASVRELVNELAARIFTDVGLRRSTSWQATRHLVEAVSKYRSALHAKGTRRLDLLYAERELLAAIDEDAKLFEAYYDLGVVYTELGQRASARSAFETAMAIDPTRWEPHYAVAQTGYSAAVDAGGQIQDHNAIEILDHCRRVIEMKPGPGIAAAVHNTMGLVEERRGGEGAWAVSAREREAACRLSLRALAAAELKGYRADSDPAALHSQREETALFLRNLAVAYANVWLGDKQRFRRIKRALELSNALNPSNADLHWEFGKIARYWGRLELAERELHTAAQIDPAHQDVLLTLAEVRAGLAPKEQWKRPVEAAARRTVELADLVDLDNLLDTEATLMRAKAVLDAVESEDAEKVQGAIDFVTDLMTLTPVEDHWTEAVEKFNELRSEGRYKEAGTLCCLFARRLGEGAPPEEPVAPGSDDREGWWEAALRLWTDGGWLDDIRRRGVYGELALALRDMRRYQEAVGMAQRGIEADALSAWDRARLGDVYYSMSDWAHARESYELALTLDPDNHQYHRSVGLCLWNLASNPINAEERRRTLREAARHLENGLALYERSANRSDPDFSLQAHYDLAGIYMDANQMDNCISHFLVAATWDSVAPVVRLNLAQAYRFANAFDEASLALNTALEEVEQSPDTTEYGADVDDLYPRDLLLALLHEQAAEVAVQRDSQPAIAKRCLQKARKHAHDCDERYTKDVLSACLSLEAELLLREGKLDDSIAKLHEALNLSIDPAFYVGLADAYAAKLPILTGVERELALRCAFNAYDQACKTDTTWRGHEIAEPVRRRLERLADTPPVAVPIIAGDGDGAAATVET
jgi:tetratricopeptide (TPR) repeat protein